MVINRKAYNELWVMSLIHHEIWY